MANPETDHMSHGKALRDVGLDGNDMLDDRNEGHFHGTVANSRDKLSCQPFFFSDKTIIFSMPSRRLIKDPERYKTVLCANFVANGECPFGHKCQFAHGKIELRPRVNVVAQNKRRDVLPYVQSPLSPYMPMAPMPMTTMPMASMPMKPTSMPSANYDGTTVSPRYVMPLLPPPPVEHRTWSDKQCTDDLFQRLQLVANDTPMILSSSVTSSVTELSCDVGM